MQALLQAVLALLAAAGIATGAPADNSFSPDRPSIVSPAAAYQEESGPESYELKGTVETVKGNVIVVNGERIKIGPETKVEGDLREGAATRIEFYQQSDGTLIAKEIEVLGADDSYDSESPSDDERDVRGKADSDSTDDSSRYESSSDDRQDDSSAREQYDDSQSHDSDDSESKSSGNSPDDHSGDNSDDHPDDSPDDSSDDDSHDDEEEDHEDERGS